MKRGDLMERMKHAPALLPCPFCGSDDVAIHHATTGYVPTVYYPNNPGYVECARCGCRTSKRIYAKSAVENWNKRVKQ